MTEKRLLYFAYSQGRTTSFFDGRPLQPPWIFFTMADEPMDGNAQAPDLGQALIEASLRGDVEVVKTLIAELMQSIDEGLPAEDHEEAGARSSARAVATLQYDPGSHIVHALATALVHPSHVHCVCVTGTACTRPSFAPLRGGTSR